MELFRQRAGINLLGVPYKGAGAAMVDVAAGDVPLIFTTVSTARPLLDSNRIRAIAVGARKRTRALPNLPTFEELGLTGMDAPLWIGMVAPRGTPEPVIKRLHAEFSRALAAPDVQDRRRARGSVADGPRELRRRYEARSVGEVSGRRHKDRTVGVDSVRVCEQTAE